jgi:hypothetical protein
MSTSALSLLAKVSPLKRNSEKMIFSGSVRTSALQASTKPLNMPKGGTKVSTQNTCSSHGIKNTQKFLRK